MAGCVAQLLPETGLGTRLTGLSVFETGQQFANSSKNFGVIAWIGLLQLENLLQKPIVKGDFLKSDAGGSGPSGRCGINSLHHFLQGLRTEFTVVLRDDTAAD